MEARGPHPAVNLNDASMQDLAYLIDVDNTLLDNDRVTADLKRHLIDVVRRRRASSATGPSSRSCASSSATPTTSARCSAIASSDRAIRDRSALSLFLLHYPFAERVYPGALDAIARAAARARRS